LALAALGEPSFSSAWEMGRSTPAAVLFTEARDWRPIAAETFDRSGVLTRRELEILSLLSTGSTNREIADSLFLSIRTIDTHVSNIITKLGVNSRHAAVEAAQARGLITR
jgi:DNA-binding NarL/FixJ family response regulator